MMNCTSQVEHQYVFNFIPISIVVTVNSAMVIILINMMLTINPGMKQNKAGFIKEAFPWTGESETKEDERRQ